jgi:mRNA-degrading endonuclease toxin of MazEF toxin-antitoxin module
MAVSFVISRIGVTVINGLGSVSVERNQGESFGAFRRSLALLSKGKNVLVFPEDAKQPADPITRLQPWLCGFVGLCGMHERETGQRLPIHPMAVHPDTRTITVGPVLFSENTASRRLDVRRTRDLLKQHVAGLYLAQQARTHATHS